MDARRQITVVALACALTVGCGGDAGGASPGAVNPAAGSGGGASPVVVQGGAGAKSPAAAGAVAAGGGGKPATTPPPTTAAGSGGKPAAPPPPSGGQAGTPAAAGAAAPPTGSSMVMIEHPDPKKSAGCGMPAPMAGNATIDVMGTAREYILALPQGYDPNTPYKLIFAWHGLGGSAQQVASNWYGLSRMAQNTAIFVAGQGLMTMTNVGDGAGWPNTNGQDVAFVKALYAQLQGQLCLDENRVFSTGMSYGGIMSNTLGCQMGDVIRAIAPMSGSGPGFGGRGANCVGQVAVWMSHGDNDTVVPTMSGEMSRDYWVNANHCQMPGVSVDPSPCVAYTGCDTDSPVTFCEFAGGHTVPPFASAAIWTFFSQF